MSLTIHKTKVRKIIQTLRQWNKKPSLEYDLGSVLDDYCYLLNHGAMNFTETALVIDEYVGVWLRMVSLLHKETCSLCERLCSALRRPDEEIQSTSNEAGNETNSNSQQQAVAETSQATKSAEQLKKEKEKHKKEEPKKKEKNKKKGKGKPEETGESSKKITIPGLPDEVLESLNLNNTDCNIDEVFKECLNKLTTSHPLYYVIAKIGDEISRTKNMVTYNDISLTGKSWNILYVLENLLNKVNPLNGESSIANEITTNESTTNESTTNETESTTVSQNVDNCANNVISDPANTTENITPTVQNVETTLTCTQVSENGVEDIDSMYESHNTEELAHTEPESLVNEGADSLNNANENTQPENSNTHGLANKADTETSVTHINSESNLDNQNMETATENSANKSLSDAELRKIALEKCKIELKEIKINLLRLPLNILLRVDYFKLTDDFFVLMKKTKVEKKIKQYMKEPTVITRKRQRQLDAECRRLVKRIKSYDLEAFEAFCHSYNVDQGICSPFPDKICLNRKSVDNRSDVSYGYPVTPDSGRFSMSFHTDSEFEHIDFDSEHDVDAEVDHDVDRACTPARPDSGCCSMSPPHDSPIDSALPFSSEPVPTSEDPTLQKLKEMFPNSFADPQRAEMLKNLVRPPEKEAESENYQHWKEFINEKVARDTEFNIHKYGSDILDSFPTKKKDEVISFKSVVKNKSVGDITRYFVSALQLANTYNVEICDERQGVVKAEGFNLKFISEERPHEEFDDLNSISESQFFENLASTSQPNHSTPYPSSQESSDYNRKSVKRRRIEYT